LDAVVPPAFETESAFVPVVAHTGVVIVKVSASGFVVLSVEMMRVEPHSVTVIVAVKCSPVTFTFNPPTVGPLSGVREVTTGAATYLKTFAIVEPPALPTETPFVPFEHAGVVKVNVSSVGFVRLSVENVRL
jgi:hypothetical protein